MTRAAGNAGAPLRALHPINERNDSAMRFLGIDLGTGSLKLAIVDAQGNEVAAASAAYSVIWVPDH